jgi:hypothetical protein
MMRSIGNSTDGTSSPHFYRNVVGPTCASRNVPFFHLTDEERKEYRNLWTALNPITDAPKHTALYLYLVKHNRLDEFLTAYKEAENAPATQPA